MKTEKKQIKYYQNVKTFLDKKKPRIFAENSHS